MKPVVDRLKKQYAGKVDFKLYNVEASSEGASLAQRYGVTAVPTFVFLNADGSKAGQQVGTLSEAQLRATLDALE